MRQVKSCYKLKILLTVVVTLLIIGSFFPSSIASKQINIENKKMNNIVNVYKNKLAYTTIFTNITAKEAYDLINTQEKLLIIDCRGLECCSPCQFNRGHLPGTELNDILVTLYQDENDYQNITDILVYSKNGLVGADFCSGLLNHVYSKIYNLNGGYEAWVAAGYPIYPIQDYTTLQIMNLDNKLGTIFVDIKNDGILTAKNISIKIKVEGGFFSLIHFTSFCIDCENLLEAGEIKTENIIKDGYIFGFGPIEITVSAWAWNAYKNTTTQKAFIFGLKIFIK